MDRKKIRDFRLKKKELRTIKISNVALEKHVHWLLSRISILVLDYVIILYISTLLIAKYYNISTCVLINLVINKRVFHKAVKCF